MSDSYLECMVERRTPAWQAFLKYLVYFFTAAAVILYFLTQGTLIMIAAILFGVGCYFVTTLTDIEYEYLYLDKEITVDKIMHKSKRKRVAVYSVDKIEIMAPINSHQLDSYKNRTFKNTDVSSNIVNQPDKRYCFYYDGKECVIFEPTEEFVKLVKNVAPRKVFMD